MSSTYLFLLCPPYTGSTVLWKLIGTSPQASCFATEGQFVPEVESVMRSDPWNPESDMPWKHIKSVWDKYWDPTKLYWVEKSPPNILRAHQIRDHFSPARFIVMVRNPYAHAEGIMRRRSWDVKKAASFALMCLQFQMQNAKTLVEAFVLTYEELVAKTEKVSRGLCEFFPGLGPIRANAEFSVHSIDGVVRRKITDLNTKKINALSSEERNQMNEVFAKDRSTMDFWHYPLLEI